MLATGDVDFYLFFPVYCFSLSRLMSCCCWAMIFFIRSGSNCDCSAALFAVEIGYCCYCICYSKLKADEVVGYFLISFMLNSLLDMWSGVIGAIGLASDTEAEEAPKWYPILLLSMAIAYGG